MSHFTIITPTLNNLQIELLEYINDLINVEFASPTSIISTEECKKKTHDIALKSANFALQLVSNVITKV